LDPGLPVHKVRPYLKNSQSKQRAGDMAQTVEHLLSKLEALSSNSNTTQKTFFKEKKER
jgi:hypothetical protein